METIGDKESVSDERDRMSIFDLWLEPNPLKCRNTWLASADINHAKGEISLSDLRPLMGNRIYRYYLLTAEHDTWLS